MTPKQRTGIWIAAAGAILAFREAYMLYKRQPDSTVSEAIWSVATFPLVPFATGFLMGHLFWQTTETYQEEVQQCL
jgi:hypothetical protein